MNTNTPKQPTALCLTDNLRETNVQGLLLECIQKAAPEAYAARIKRLGVVNAWNDPNFAEAVRKTGKKQLIVAGVTTDVCLVPPALSMQEEGFHIKVGGLWRSFVLFNGLRERGKLGRKGEGRKMLITDEIVCP